MSTPIADRTKRNNFNLLRIIGAFGVIFSHTYDILGISNKEPIALITHNLFEASAFGLTIFFFISGYFVTKSLLTSNSLLLFIKKRILRIYPALITLIIISVFIAGPLLTTLPVSAYFSSKETWMYLYNITGIRIRMNLPGVFDGFEFKIQSFNASLWSIALEIWLYLSLMMLGIFGLKNNQWFRFIVAVVCLTGFILVSLNPQFSFVVKRALYLMSVFYLGATFYIFQLNKIKVFYLLCSSIVLYTFFWIKPLVQFNPFFLLLIALSCIIFFIGFSDKIIIPVKTDISYGLYIFAFPVQQMVFKYLHFNATPVIFILDTMLYLIPIALLSWFFIEKPAIDLKYK
jgi:hypothetical protein